ncbi:MAG: glutathione S-transferase family protein [Nevskiaceae bacterium]
MLTVHHLNNSRSQRVLWLLEELEAAYEIRRYERDSKSLLAPPTLRKIHPLGKSPVITDGDLTVVESGAIIEYLLERYGRGRLAPSPGAPARRRFTYWLHYAEGSLMPLLVMKLVFARVESAPAPFFVRPLIRAIVRNVNRAYLDRELRLHLGYLEGELTKHAWFAGEEFSAADVQMSFPVEAAFARGGAGAAYPRLRAWLDRIQARPAYRRALEKGGPYQVLPG